MLTVVLGGQEHAEVELSTKLAGKSLAQLSATVEQGSGSAEFALDGRALRRGRVLARWTEKDTMSQRERVATAGRPRGVETWFWFVFGLLVLSEGDVRLWLARRTVPRVEQRRLTLRQPVRPQGKSLHEARVG